METPSVGKTAILTPDSSEVETIAEADDQTSVETVMWIGPPIPYLKQGAAFLSTELPSFLSRYIEQCPAVSDLLVPLDDYVPSLREVKRVGSQLRLAYKVVTEYFNRR